MGKSPWGTAEGQYCSWLGKAWGTAWGTAWGWLRVSASGYLLLVPLLSKLAGEETERYKVST